MAPFRDCIRIFAVSVCLTMIVPCLSLAELKPADLAVIVNDNSPESWSVARQYAARRGIPSSHIIALDLPLEDTLSRSQYETLVVPPLREALQNRGLAAQVRVLVTTYGVPKGIRAGEQTAQQRAWVNDARQRYDIARQRLESLEHWIQMLGDPRAVPKPVSSRAPSREVSAVPLDLLFQRVAQEIREAAARLKSSPNARQAEREGHELAQLTLQFGGVAALIQRLKPSAIEPSQLELAEKIKRQVASAEILIQVLNQSPSDQNRQRAYTLAGQIFGLQGTLRLATAEMDIYGLHDSDASFDSELSLLWCDVGSYYVAGRTHNPLYDQPSREALGSGSAQEAALVPQLVSLPVLMVSRLDGLTPDIAQRLVEKALEAEQHGLDGKVYITTPVRNEPGSENGRESQRDEWLEGSLREVASAFRVSPSNPVVLQDSDRDGQLPGESVEAAVYVGSGPETQTIRFVAGALGYRLPFGGTERSSYVETPSWHNLAVQHGITATVGSIGAVSPEAYPKPGRFFALLLTGRYSLVEAYYLTLPYLSWRMVLIGDPLYNPWRTRPISGMAMGVLPEPPSRLRFPEPVAALQELRTLRQMTLDQIDRVMTQP